MNVNKKYYLKGEKMTREKMRVGFTCSSFDLLHAGHILMLEDARDQCDRLVVGLQIDPSVDRPEKNKPIQSLEERKIQIEAVRFVDEVIPYETEEDLHKILKHSNFHVRILGSDWKNKEYTGKELPILVYFHERNHNFSTSELRKRVFDKEGER